MIAPAEKSNERGGRPSPLCAALVLAAGHSTRMGGGISKQLLPLCGVPVLARTLIAFEECRAVGCVVVVAGDETFVPAVNLVHDGVFTKVKSIVRGGETRQQSAAAGLAEILLDPAFAQAGEGEAFLAVHDGARPLVTADEIDRVVGAAAACGAAAAAARLVDTVKLADTQGNVLSTPPRDALWAVQTPQVFELTLYRRALMMAFEQRADYTDDCQLIENADGRVRLVECGRTNFKITTRMDIALAEAVIRERNEGEGFFA